MNWRKVFWSLIWFLIILIGALTYKYIPTDWIYSYGFMFGSLALGALEMRK